MTFKDKKTLSTRSIRLNKFLKKKRLESKLTQLEVASKIGLDSAQYISNFERNMHPPSFEVLGKLIKIYKIKKAEMIDIMVEDQKDFLKKALR